MQLQKLPAGEQSFLKIRKQKELYVDKTRQIYRMINFSDYVFLSRPRRFGKSVLVGTLAALFEGKRELFKGLWIEDKWDWQPYPVIRIDFARTVSTGSLEQFNQGLLLVLQRYARSYKISIPDSVDDARYYLAELIIELYETTGQLVVILIDEYDKPITNNLKDLEKAEAIRIWLRELYEQIKASGDYIRYFFITGISKFAKMSIFSVLNNLQDISLQPEFNDLIGFTYQELLDNFSAHIELLAVKENTTTTIILQRLQYWYNGYSWGGEEGIYNPYCLLNVFLRKNFDYHWFSSGTPNFLVELIRNRYAQLYEKPPILEDFVNVVADRRTFDSYQLKDINLIGLLFQTGYLTITSSEKIGVDMLYTLNYPNHEVRWSFNSYLLELFVFQDVGSNIIPKGLLLRKALQQADFDTFFTIIESFFTSIPHQILKRFNEYTYQSLFYMLLTLLGVENVILEKNNFKGRADGILEYEDKVYMIEFKFARAGKMSTLLGKALEQINKQGYHLPYKSSGKTIYQLAVGFLYKKKEKEENASLEIDYEKKIV